MGTLRTGAALCALLLAAAPAIAGDMGKPITGTARVLDGDTIEITGQRIRLAAIDAPENDQTCGRPSRVSFLGEIYECGQDAAALLAELMRGQTVICIPQDQDRYNRTIAVCGTPMTVDLGGAMVRRGWAVPYLKYGGSIYLEQERQAKAEKLGMHSGRFTMPEQWRRDNKR